MLVQPCGSGQIFSLHGRSARRLDDTEKRRTPLASMAEQLGVMEHRRHNEDGIEYYGGVGYGALDNPCKRTFILLVAAPR